MDFLIALFGWISFWMILYAGGLLGYSLAEKLKLTRSGWLLCVAGVIAGAALIAETDFPITRETGWVEEHIIAAKFFFTTWYLAIFATLGWIHAVYTFSRIVLPDMKGGKPMIER